MRTIILTLTLLATLLATSGPRCRVDIYRGRAWLICPCKKVTYVCEDYYRIPVYHGRISVR